MIMNIMYVEGAGKSETQEATGESDKDEPQRKKSTGVQSEVGKKSLTQASEDERRISLYIPSQELTLHSLRPSEQ